MVTISPLVTRRINAAIWLLTAVELALFVAVGLRVDELQLFAYLLIRPFVVIGMLLVASAIRRFFWRLRGLFSRPPASKGIVSAARQAAVEIAPEATGPRKNIRLPIEKVMQWGILYDKKMNQIDGMGDRHE